MVDAISKFTKVNAGRHFNDTNNKIRENVITRLWNPPSEYIADSNHGLLWIDVSAKFKTIISSLCKFPFDDVIIKKKAGRKFNYDFHLLFMNNKVCVHEEYIEFKHNAKTICEIPQYLNLSENVGFMPYHSYSEFFYDQYIEKLCNLANLEVPDKDKYMKFIYQNSYDKLPFFRKLKDAEASIKKEKSKLVNESISRYLEKYSAILNLQMLNHAIVRTQTKQYLLWDGKEFHLDKFSEDEMKVISVDSVKNENTLIINSNTEARHHMLLRWKNRKGILYPAWQIKLTR